MKKLILLLVLMLILGGVAYFLNSSSPTGPTSSIDVSDRAFAVESIDDIYKITLQKPYQDGILLSREGDHWVVNNQYKVAKSKIPYLLKTLGNVEIQNIPSSATVETIKEEMSRNGIQVKIYDKNDQLIKSYMVGNQSHDDQGVAMLMDGATQPYNVFMPGFEGELRGRFNNSVTEWRDREIFKVEAADIEYVSIEYHKQNSASFSLKNTSPATVTPLSDFITAKNQEPNQDKIRAYLGDYQKLYAENFDNENIKRDSITKLIPFATVKLKQIGKDLKEVDFYSLYEVSDPTLENVNYADKRVIEKFYANTSWGDFMLVQGLIFNKVFVNYDHFY